MSGYYDNIGELQQSHPMPSDGQIKLPESALDAVPYRLKNIPYDRIVFVGSQTVTLDKITKAVQLDTKDLVATSPSSEVRLREKPAVMKVISSIGGVATDGYLVDYRHIGFPVERDYGLSQGIHSIRFQEHVERYGTVFPLGILINNAGRAEYMGEDAFIASAEHMMQRVDDFVAKRWPDMPKFTYSVPDLEDAIQRPNDEKTADNGQLANQESSDIPATNTTIENHD